MHRVSSVLAELGALETPHAPQPEEGKRPDGLPRWVVWTPAPGVELTARVVQAHPSAALVEWSERVPDGGYYVLRYRRTWAPLRRLRPYRAPARV